VHTAPCNNIAGSRDFQCRVDCLCRVCSTVPGLQSAETDHGARLLLQVTSRMPDATVDQSGPVTHAEAQQLLQLVTADQAELQRLPPAAVEAAQALASQRNGQLRTHGPSRSMLADDAQDIGVGMPSREAAASRSSIVQRHADLDAHDPLQAVLAAEAGLQRVQTSEASWPDSDSLQPSPTADDPSAQPKQVVSLLALPQPCTATAAQGRRHGPAVFHPAHAVRRVWPEAEESRPTHCPMDALPAAAPDVVELAPAWQEPLPGSPRGAESEASWQSSQWSDSGSETSSSAWSEMSADERARVQHKAFSRAIQPSALAATGSRQPEHEETSGPGVELAKAGLVPDSVAAPNLPLTRASLLQMWQPDDGITASRQHVSPGSLRVEAVSEQGLSSDDEDAVSSRLLLPGLLVARLPLMPASLSSLASNFPPSTSGQSSLPEPALPAGSATDSYSSPATIQPAADPTRLHFKPLPRAGVSTQASEAPPPRHSRSKGMLCSLKNPQVCAWDPAGGHPPSRMEEQSTQRGPRCCCSQ